MTPAEFKRQVAEASADYFPYARLNFTEQRGIKVQGRIVIDDANLIDVYYSALKGKTTFALVRMGRRIFGYDNLRGWHRHPVENPDQHVACPEPTPRQGLREIKEILDRE
jgi:hypothetical protein